METDIPLRTLTEACADDLLSLLGTPDDEVLSVESLELPAFAARLDNLLRLRDWMGRIYLHLVEWQGYCDQLFLWRVLGYLAWLGQHLIERPILVTLIYLKPGDDTGDGIRQELEGLLSWAVSFRCVRLWEEDAVAAARSGRVGLAVLSPLMRGATTPIVEEAARVVLGAVEDPQRRADLLSVLGALAEDLMAPEQFVAMMGREQLMESGLLNLLVREKTVEMEAERARERAELEQQRARERAELEQQRARERAELERERAQLEQAYQILLERERAHLEQAHQAQIEQGRARAQAELERDRAQVTATLVLAVEEAITLRFPTAPLTLATSLHRVQDMQALRELLGVALRAPDLDSIQRAIEAASA